jgi:hypothetical protein
MLESGAVGREKGEKRLTAEFAKERRGERRQENHLVVWKLCRSAAGAIRGERRGCGPIRLGRLDGRGRPSPHKHRPHIYSIPHEAPRPTDSW